MWSDWLTAMPIAHRGLHDVDGGRPENSLAAFEFAAKFGIPIELDVQQAGDGTLIVMHDANVERVTGECIEVSHLRRSDLGRLKLRSSGDPVPLLTDVLTSINGVVPIVLDVRRWNASTNSDLAAAVLAEISGYPGPLALQSFDPLIVWQLRRGVGQRFDPDRRVGQVSGLLRSANRIVAPIGRSMIANWATRPDYISYEIDALTSRFVRYWQLRRHLPVVAFTVTSPEEEERACRLARNFFFDGYVPKVYRDKLPEEQKPDQNLVV